MTRKGKDKQPSPFKIYTRAEFAKVAKERGWTIVKGRGKGGHWWFEKEGEHAFSVPDEMGPGLQEQIKKWLGLK